MLSRVTFVAKVCFFLSAGSVSVLGAGGTNASDAHEAWKSLESQATQNTASVNSEWKAPNILKGRYHSNALDGTNCPNALSNAPNAPNALDALDGTNRINARGGRNCFNALDGRNRVNAMDGSNRINALD